MLLKHLSDAFERHLATASNEPRIGNRNHQARAQAQELWIPPAARWPNIRSHASDPYLGKYIDSAFRSIERHNDCLKGLLPNNHRYSRSNKKVLRSALGLVSSIDDVLPEKRAATKPKKKRLKVAYETSYGKCFQGSAEEVLAALRPRGLTGRVDLIFTSPPFPLNKKKKYGNLNGQEYIDWLASFSSQFKRLLKPHGSIVIEVGNAWEPGLPVMSPLALKALLALLDAGQFSLCQQFIWHNPARLPSPAQWVTIERIRVKDSFTHLWWMSPTSRPKADNRRILKEYSGSMLKLLRLKKYNSGKRPSEHNIGTKSFFSNNGGAIRSNVITLSNTTSGGRYVDYCRQKSLTRHPARMPPGLAEFFIKFLTKPGDLVLDPFAGSNTTGAAAESLKRRWISIEADAEYIKGSRGRFRKFNPRY